ncbi:MAG: hypothetical protein COA69_13805 [Robiginitomaculum sp.]|nr:MAG: hypothetical protein COA69_13805 [Robiginitomaculum sp.]
MPEFNTVSDSLLGNLLILIPALLTIIAGLGYVVKSIGILKNKPATSQDKAIAKDALENKRLLQKMAALRKQIDELDEDDEELVAKLPQLAQELNELTEKIISRTNQPHK